MGGRSGYEYSYGFWVEDEIIPLYRICIWEMWYYGYKGFLFEIRTSFKVKRISSGDDDDGHGQIMMMGSERFGSAVQEDRGRWLEPKTAFRLKDYWMSDDEIKLLVRDALDFAQLQRAANPQRSLIPVVVGLDVCTVQQEGELINETIDRAIRPECLLPLYLWEFIIPEGSVQFNDKPYRHRKSFLLNLPRIRVEDDDAGMALMDVCPVCLHRYAVAAQISFLSCEHACHSRCLFNWLQKRNYSCPLCGVHIPSELEELGLSESEQSSSDSE